MKIKEDVKILLSTAKIINNPILIRYLTGKAYNSTKLAETLFHSKYLVLGEGVIKAKYMNNYISKKGLTQLIEHFIPIKNEEDFQNFITRFNEEEKIEQEKEEQKNQTWLQELDLKLANLDLDPAQKEKIMNIIASCPSNKHELEQYFWKIVDMKITQGKAIDLLNTKPGIKIDKNTYTKKKRNKWEIQ